MSEKIKQKIIDALSGLTNKRVSTERVVIQCPYHPDKTPSATINLSSAAPAPLGWFRCFGCAKSVPWNTLAKTLGLPKIGKNKRTHAEDYLDPFKFKSELLDSEETTDVGFEKELHEMEFFDFQFEEWRGVSVKLLKRVGARLCYLDRTGDFYVWLPVYIDSVLRGYVKAELEKPEEGTSYINASGKWSQASGLLFYDYSVALAKRKGVNTLVLVEGPRDALRLLRYGIPAIAVLGAINWNDDKRWCLEQSRIENIVIFMDGDDAGIKATKKINKSIKTHFNVIKIMKLWKHRVPRLSKSGKHMTKKLADGEKRLLWDNELDPGNCPLSFLKEVKQLLV